MTAAPQKRRCCWEANMNNPYKVLGVSEDASQEEIRTAYLKLVKKYHPDKYTDTDLKELANEKLVEINEAYEALTKKKRIYAGFRFWSIFQLWIQRTRFYLFWAGCSRLCASARFHQPEQSASSKAGPRYDLCTQCRMVLFIWYHLSAPGMV